MMCSNGHTHWLCGQQTATGTPAQCAICDEMAWIPPAPVYDGSWVGHSTIPGMGKVGAYKLIFEREADDLHTLALAREGMRGEVE